MYIPRHFHWIFPVSVILLGFYLSQNYGQSYDVVIVFLSLNATALMHGMYIWRAGEMYQGYVTQSRPAVEPLVNWHTGQVVEEVPSKAESKPKTNDFKPLIRVDGKIAYAQIAIQPKFDKVRYVAFTLLRQHENGFRVDLTEKRWVRNWKFSRDEFLGEVIDRWKYHNVIGRAGDRRNAPYDVMKWDAIRLEAQGNHLPPPPR